MMNTLPFPRTTSACILGFALATGAFAENPGPGITGELHLKITDGKGTTKEYHLSQSAVLPMDLLPLIELLASEDGLDEIASFAEQSLHTWSDDLMRRLAMRGENRKPWLGVAVQPVPAEVAAQLPQLAGAGLIVRDAAPGSPAAAAGLLFNDVLTGLNEQILFSEDQLIRLIATFAPGDEVTLKWMRDAREMTALATLTAANPHPQGPVLGPDAAAFLNRQFGPEVAFLLEMTAANPQLIADIPLIRNVVRIDEQGNIRWMVEDLMPALKGQATAAAFGIREQLETRAPELLPAYDRMLLELASEPDLENLVDQLGKEYRKATPEMRRRAFELVEKMMGDLMKELEEK